MVYLNRLIELTSVVYSESGVEYIVLVFKNDLPCGWNVLPNSAVCSVPGHDPAAPSSFFILEALSRHFCKFVGGAKTIDVIRSQQSSRISTLRSC
jgi:hypothetical protein